MVKEMKHLRIEKVIGREIIDSRGNPTVEAEVYLADGTMARGTAPSGASTGEFEALELRDGEKERYLGKGVQKAVANINTIINDVLCGMDADRHTHSHRLFDLFLVCHRQSIQTGRNRPGKDQRIYHQPEYSFQI